MTPPLRIGLIMQGGSGWAGGSEYIRNLVLACGGLPAAERAQIELCLISGSPLPPKLACELAPHLAHSYSLTTDQPPATLTNRARWIFDRRLRSRINTRFADFVAAESFDFLYPLTYDNQYNIGVALPLGTQLGRCRWAGWIPDFQHRFLPQLFTPGEIAKRDAGIAALARDAKTIVFSSESAASHFARFFPEASAASKVLRFHTCPAESWFEAEPEAAQRRFHLPDRFFLVSNQFWQHKNHAALFEALALLRAQDVEPFVVCTGHPSDFRDKDFFNSLLARVHELGIARQVALLGLIARADQIQLMRRSIAVVQPSLFEGWSTVIEDARALGKPVIFSDIAVHREQAPPGGAAFESTSPASLAALLAEWWKTRAPGPDHTRERDARERGVALANDYARRFLEMARTAK